MYYLDIVLCDIAVQIPTMQGSAICCHEQFVVSVVNNDVMTTPTAKNGCDDVTELHVTSKWFGML